MILTTNSAVLTCRCITGPKKKKEGLLNNRISRSRFEELLDVTSDFNLPYLAFKDDIHHVRQLIKA